MKLFFRLLGGLFILSVTVGILGGGVAAFWGLHEFARPRDFDKAIEITIPTGANIGGVADTLSYHGILDFKGSLVFQLGGRATGQAAKLKAGEYEIPPRASIMDILDLLESGKVIQRTITIREGLTNWEIKQLLLAHEELTQEEGDIELLPEGSYLPETYSYQKGDTPSVILKRMHTAMSETLKELWAGRAENLPIETMEQALVLASIIEKETAVPEERKRVAGVFVNRLRQGIPLQTDPTVIYALNKGEHQNEGQGPLGRRLLKKDLEFDSPYNTYLYAGLPPAPIANAGRASIEAALHPEAHDYIYFVADGSGGHVFAKTLNEHNRNAAQWRKIRNGQ